MTLSVPTCSIGEVRMKPVNDPNSDKYPDRVFYAGRWCTSEQIERERERLRRMYHTRRANDPSWVEERQERQNEIRRQRYLKDDEYRERTRENNNKWFRKKYYTDDEWVELRKQASKEWFDNLSGRDYNRRLLKSRRTLALMRASKRNQLREEHGSLSPQE